MPSRLHLIIADSSISNQGSGSTSKKEIAPKFPLEKGSKMFVHKFGKELPPSIVPVPSKCLTDFELTVLILDAHAATVILDTLMLCDLFRGG